MGNRAEELKKAESRAADSGFRTRTRIVPVLRQGTREFRVDRGELTVGRSALCDIRVESALVSRRHARLTLTSLGVTVEDLASRNGVYVNSERAVGVVRLKSGDRIAFGDEVLLLGEIEEPIGPEHEATLAALPSVRDRSAETEEITSLTRNADVFQVLGNVVDKALSLGRGADAEQLIGDHLVTTLHDAENGRHVPADLARTAAGYAIKLAGATSKASWLDHAVKLYRALDLVLPLALVDEMYVLLRRVQGLNLTDLRAYTDTLRLRELTLAPAERFVLQRLLGLERLAAWQNGTER